MKKAICLVLLLSGWGRAQDWPAYGGDDGGTRFSQLSQISVANVAQLRLAWSVPTEEQNTYPGTWSRFAGPESSLIRLPQNLPRQILRTWSRFAGPESSLIRLPQLGDAVVAYGLP